MKLEAPQGLELITNRRHTGGESALQPARPGAGGQGQGSGKRAHEALGEGPQVTGR